MQSHWLLLFCGMSILAQAQANLIRDIKTAVTSGINTATNTVTEATDSATAAVLDVTSTAANTVTSATSTTVEAVSYVQGTAVRQTQKFQADIGNLTVHLGEELAGYISNAVFNGQRHPIVFWPAYGTSVLHVEVQGSTVQSCPSSGSFDVGFGQPTILSGFPEACVYPLLQMQYNASTGVFANAQGVNTSIHDFGGQFCAPIPYEPLFAIAQAIGYTAGQDFMVACYDWRTTPYADVGTDGPHLQRAQQLVEQAYTNSGWLPVYLLGHSNGPLYALALLRKMSFEWRAKYVAGFIGYAGNWVGQGVDYNQLFSGGSLFDDSVYPASAPAYESWPSTYMSLSSPAFYGASEVVIRTTNATGSIPPRDYTPADALQLFQDAGLRQAQVLGPLLLGNTSSNSTAPGTHFYGFIGTGVKTQVGTTYTTLQQQQAPVAGGEVFNADGGDGNQENADNTAIAAWPQLQDPCFHFELNKEEGAEHLTLPFKPSVVKRTVEILYSADAPCDGEAPGAALVGSLVTPVGSPVGGTEAQGTVLSQSQRR